MLQSMPAPRGSIHPQQSRNRHNTRVDFALSQDQHWRTTRLMRFSRSFLCRLSYIYHIYRCTFAAIVFRLHAIFGLPLAPQIPSRLIYLIWYHLLFITPISPSACRFDPQENEESGVGTVHKSLVSSTSVPSLCTLHLPGPKVETCRGNMKSHT